MTLDQQLRHLEDQRYATWHAAGRELVHWKHDLRRAASPTRLIRKHLGVSLLLAGLLGVLAAPLLRSGPTNHSPTRHHRLHGLWRLAQRLIPQLRGTPGATESSAPGTPPAAHHNGTGSRNVLLAFVLPLLARLDWQAITAAWLAGMSSHRSPPSPSPSPISESSHPTATPAEPHPAAPRPPGDDRNRDVDVWSG